MRETAIVDSKAGVLQRVQTLWSPNKKFLILRGRRVLPHGNPVYVPKSPGRKARQKSKCWF